MNPLRIRGENVGRFASFDVEIPQGRTAITGPNGAGKSTLLNAIELALFANGARDLGHLLGPLSDRGRLLLDFEHDGLTYRVAREFGKKTTLDLIVLDDAGAPNLTLTRETTKATQAELERILGLSRRTFRASAFLAQGDSGAFPDADPAERKQILGEALDPHGVWAWLHDKAKEDAKQADREADRLVAEIEKRQLGVNALPGKRQELADLETREATARRMLSIAETRLELATEECVGNEVMAEKVKTATIKRDALADQLVAARSLLDARWEAHAQIPAARDHLWKLQADAAKLDDLERQVDEQRREKIALDAAREQLRQVRERITEWFNQQAALQIERELILDEIKDLEGHETEEAAARCPMCEQLLGEEGRVKALASLNERLQNVTREHVKATEQLDRAQADLADVPVFNGGSAHEDLAPLVDAARRAAQGIPQAQHNLSTLEAASAEIPSLSARRDQLVGEVEDAIAALAAASDGVKDQAELEAERADATRDVREAQAALEVVVASHARATQTLEELERCERELVGLRVDQAAVEERRDVLAVAVRAYGRDGVPTLIAENAIPAIETGANVLLEQLPTEDGQVLRLELHTQRETQAGGIRETLDIVVTDADGQRPYETFSGGERARLNIALRIALARLLAGRRGAESRLLAIDELEFLDELGQESLVRLLQDVDGFDRVLVVSHSPAVRDAFEQAIEVVKRDGVSRVISSVIEAVEVAA